MRTLKYILMVIAFVSIIGCSTASTSVKYDGNKSFAVEKKKVTKPACRITIRKIQEDTNE